VTIDNMAASLNEIIFITDTNMSEYFLNIVTHFEELSRVPHFKIILLLFYLLSMNK
jgi:hypothetical protein